MGNVFRIALHRMLVLFRLAVVASLALYTLPTASVAMHGDASATYTSQARLSEHENFGHLNQIAEADHHAHEDQTTTSNDDGKSAKQDCCSDFCVSFAIMTEAPDVAIGAMSGFRTHLDETSVFGQLSSLHRPPSIRA